MAQRLAVALDLAIAPLGKGDLEPRGARGGAGVDANDTDGARHRGPVGKYGPPPPAREILGPDPTLDLHLVHARDLEAGMQEAIAELAVVGEQQQALRVKVEATDGE